MTEFSHDHSPGPSNGLGAPVAMSDATRRDMLRANTVVAVVLTAVLALALVAVFAGLRATHNQRRAEAAEAEDQERLRIALTEEARAIRLSAQAGGRAAALNAISNAVAIRVSPELRTEAIACLALADLVPEGTLVPTARNLSRLLVDPQLRYYTYDDEVGKVYVNSLSADRSNLVFNTAEVGNQMRRPVDGLDFSPDGGCLAADLADGSVAVWSLVTHQLVFINRFLTNNSLAPTPLRGLAFTHDSRRLIFSDPTAQGQISIYDLATGRRESSGIPAWGKTFRLRPDLQVAALTTDTRVDLLDYPAGTLRHSLTLPVPVITLAWSPDGRRLAVSGADGEIYLWEPATGAQSHFTGHSEAGIRLGFNSTGTLLFSSSRDGTTRLWDVALGRIVTVGQGFGCAFSPDDQHILYWKPWEGFGRWRVTASHVYTLHECDKSAGPLISVDLSPSGRWCAVTQGRGVRMWDLAGNDSETYIQAAVSGARVAMDEQSLFVCASNGLAAWPLTTNAAGTVSFTPENARLIPMPGHEGTRAVTLSRDGHWAVVELWNRGLVRIDLTGTHPLVRMHGRWLHFNNKGSASPTGAGRFAISPDGQWIVTGFDFDGDGPKVWNGGTGDLVTNLPVETSQAAFSPDGRWLGLSGISRNSIWSVGDWRLQKMFVREESSLVHGALAFLPGEPIAAFSQTRQIVQLRNWQTDQPVGDLIAPGAQSVSYARVSGDGQTLVMGTASYMIEVWRLGELRHELAAMNLDWNSGPQGPSGPLRPPAPGVSGWLMAPAILGGFALVTALALVTLRRHRMAIERFVVAEAQAAQINRELDIAKVELMHSQKMQALGTLATGIAHDFNNLLSVVRMSGKLISRQAPGNREIQEHVTDIEQAVLQGKSVVSSVLGYARAEKDSGELTDVSTIVEEAVSLLSREFLNGITLTLELERNAPKVNIARGPLDQVFLNLLVNASEAMQGKGRLKIIVRARQIWQSRPWVLRPRQAGHYVELSVMDSGPGIAPQIRDRIFEPFFTTKSSATKVGTGLGLSLVYSIAQQAGLGLSVESEPGKGSLFTVMIPVETAPVREKHSVKIANAA